MFPASVRGDSCDFFYHGDGDGKLFPSGEFPVAIRSPAEKRGEDEKRERGVSWEWQPAVK
jgi:hypothetical protein